MEIQSWTTMLAPYVQAVDELTLKFRHMIKQYRQNGMYSPIEQVDGRVKTVSSILEKAQRKNISTEKIPEKIEDIAGIRIICQFIEDIYTVAEIIKNRKDMTVKSSKDYIINTKESGYRSYHIIVYYTVDTINGAVKIPVEIQIRTMAMNFWATIEHSLRYKYHRDIPQHIKNKLNEISLEIIRLDDDMSTIHREITEASNYQLQMRQGL